MKSLLELHEINCWYFYLQIFLILEKNNLFLVLRIFSSTQRLVKTIIIQNSDWLN